MPCEDSILKYSWSPMELDKITCLFLETLHHPQSSRFNRQEGQPGEQPIGRVWQIHAPFIFTIL